MGRWKINIQKKITMKKIFTIILLISTCQKLFCQYDKKISLTEYRQFEKLNQFKYHRENANVALIVGAMLSYNIFAYRNSMQYKDKVPKIFFGGGVILDAIAWRECLKHTIKAYKNK